MQYKALITSAASVVLTVGALVLGNPVHSETLKTGVDATYAPLAFQNLNGQLEGFSIDLGHALEKQLGVTIQVEGTQFGSLIPAMNAKTYDFILGAVTATPERAQAMLFSEPYLSSDNLVLQKKGALAIKVLEDFKGKRLAVNRGSPYEQWAQQNHEKYGFEYSVFPTNADAIQAVQSGRADASMAGVPAQAWAAQHNPLLQQTFLLKTGLVWAFAFRKDDVKTRDRISSALKCLKQKGVVADIAKKWLGFVPDTTRTVYPGQGISGMPGYDPTPVKLNCK
jgi:ABC-type amino acid transport substrate-binding protein